MTWFKEGDKNTKFFHSQVREHVPNLSNTEQNAELIKHPTKEEVKVAVLGLNGDSAGGPDGMTCKFYHSCWDIIGDDLYDMVRAFFIGHELPKCVTYTNLVLLPKKKEVTTFSDLRPSLSNFSNKVISRVVHERLVKFLPSLISEEQSGFVKGRNIAENILLTQEIVTDIRLRTKAGPNVILKLDMTKAYDRLSWLFLTKVLRKMGFTERLIGIVFGLVSNNWYSILINGQAHGGLNALHTNLYFCGFGMPKWSPKINHLAYADDMIIFSSSDETSLMLIMQVMKAYEVASGQLVNKTKSAVYLHHLIDIEVVSKVERITGIHRNDFPIIYLGCPIFYARRKLEYYQPLITKKKGSHIWRKMLECKDLIEHQIVWQTKRGSSLFWFENWTGLGALYFLVPRDFGIDETIHNVYDVTLDGEWDVDRLFELLPEDLAVHILEKIKPPSPQQVLDMPCWMLETRGYFSVKSAWHYTRRRYEPRAAYRMIWVKGLPFKIAFFMWKVWKAKLPLDDFLKRVGYCMPSKCWCCVQPGEESLQHLFFRSETAKTTWRYFLSRARIVVEELTLHQAITKCWTANVCLRIKPVMQALPSCIFWELWKRRNSMKYGDDVTTSRVIYQVSSNMQALVKVRKPGMDMVPHKWQDLLAMMENFTPKLKVTKVMWEFPSAG
ncbi:uncharacterized protein [Nicotiana sylvestris]|uniref:uncharacterized protein n=1 Tax=Nicotiana sylvestris TaxID=4096 RepID=UPI00388C3A34